MTNVTPINRHQQAIAEGRGTGQLTSAHRCAIARIQDLAMDVSLQTGNAITVTYSGHTHEIDVHLLTYAEIERGNYHSASRRQAYLPPSHNARPDSLKQLGEIAAHLEALLPKPPAGGAA